MIHNEAQQLCANHGAMLPEPRSQEDNEFLKTLTSTQDFLLGMKRNDSGIWVWDSDGEPVVYDGWRGVVITDNHDTNKHCGAMSQSPTAGGWFDMECVYNPTQVLPTTALICEQSRTYLCISLTFSYLSLLISIRNVCLSKWLYIFFSAILKPVEISVKQSQWVILTAYLQDKCLIYTKTILQF